MTKTKLRRLIELSNRTALFRVDGEAGELQALQAEFAAWEPDRERDEARQIARELLEDADSDHWDEPRMQKRYPWLKEIHGESGE